MTRADASVPPPAGKPTTKLMVLPSKETLSARTLRLPRNTAHSRKPALIRILVQRINSFPCLAPRRARIPSGYRDMIGRARYRMPLLRIKALLAKHHADLRDCFRRQ